MIPLKDDTPRLTTPYINYFLIALNTAIFLFQQLLDRPAHDAFLYQFGMVPARVTGALHGAPDASLGLGVLTIFTSMFLHANWLHLISNMWALWIFGDNIEDHLGHFRYLLFYFGTGLAASLLHIAFNFGTQIPSVGASGAIAGVMGAYLRLFPRARIVTLVPVLFFPLFFEVPAFLFMGFWFFMQLLSGAVSLAVTNTGEGIAWWAHIGGFSVGFFLIKRLCSSRPGRCYGGEV